MPTIDIFLNPKDGMELVRIPAGKFDLGRGHHDSHFQHRVYLSEYLIGRSCVTNRQYSRFVRETGHRPPGDEDWRSGARLGKPVTDVAWEDAAAYARWAGLSLPTDAQWEKAAAGLLSLIKRRETPEEKAAIDKMLTPPDGTLSWLDAAITPYEEWLYNEDVSEWCLDWYDEAYWQADLPSDPQGPTKGKFRTVRGAGYSDASAFRGVYRGWASPSLPSTGRGFRLVHNAQNTPALPAGRSN